MTALSDENVRPSSPFERSNEEFPVEDPPHRERGQTTSFALFDATGDEIPQTHKGWVVVTKSSLTRHDRNGTRVLGYDNAHGLRQGGKGFSGRRLVYDHKHRAATDRAVPYLFETPQRLLEDFFAETDRVIQATKE